MRYLLVDHTGGIYSKYYFYAMHVGPLEFVAKFKVPPAPNNPGFALDFSSLHASFELWSVKLCSLQKLTNCYKL